MDRGPRNNSPDNQPRAGLLFGPVLDCLAAFWLDETMKSPTPDSSISITEGFDDGEQTGRFVSKG